MPKKCSNWPKIVTGNKLMVFIDLEMLKKIGKKLANFFAEKRHFLPFRKKIGNRQFQIGNFRTEFGQKLRQPCGPILKNAVAYKKKGVVA